MLSFARFAALRENDLPGSGLSGLGCARKKEGVG
jgi:hypothetical protein